MTRNPQPSPLLVAAAYTFNALCLLALAFAFYLGATA